MLDTILSVLLAVCATWSGYLGMRITLHPPQTDLEKASYKAAFIGIGVASIAVIVWQGANSHSVQEESRRDRIELNTSLQVEIRAAQTARDELQKLRRDMAAESERRDQAYKELDAKAEAEKQQQRELRRQNESAIKRRDANFVVPLKALTNRAFGNIRMMNESFFDTNHHMDEAIKWFHDMRNLLKQHCSDSMIALKFDYPDRDAGVPGLFSPKWNKRFREEYPNIINDDWIRFAAFYRLRLEDLERQDLGICR